MNSSFNISFSHLLKCLLVFRIMKLECTSKITAQSETIPQYLLFSHFSYIHICAELVNFHLQLSTI